VPVFTPKSKAIAGRAFAVPTIEEVGLVREFEAHRVPWHAHRGFQLFFALNGAAAYELQTTPPRPVEVPGGHFLVLAPGIRHRGVQDACPPCELLFLVLDSSARAAALHSPFTSREWKEVLRLFARTTLAPLRVGPDLARAVTALAEAVEAERTGQHERWRDPRLRERAGQVLVETVLQISSERTSAVDAAVAFVERHLHEHHAEPLHMDEVAARAGLSRSRLFGVFKRATGLTPNDYLQRVRVERARHLLTATEQSITAIAFGTGYASSQYFSTVFRRFTGQSPQDFRRANRRAAA
jgi:AraC-like DNA-binding protein